MQTFIPLRDLKRALLSLDNIRLSNQKRETKTIISVLKNKKKGERVGWGNHPAVLMWEGYESALKLYFNLNRDACRERGMHNGVRAYRLPSHIELPWWLGKRKFHASHRSNLLRKQFEWYGRWKWKESDSLPYVWPVRIVDGVKMYYDFKHGRYTRTQPKGHVHVKQQTASLRPRKNHQVRKSVA